MTKFLLFPLIFSGILAFGQNCMTAWQYQTPVTVTNPNATVLGDFQVNLTINTQALISAGKLNANGDDLRFVDACCTNLCYWIENGINTPITSIWVRVPYLPSSNSTTIYMLYGNNAASASSNASCTFDLYENFDSGSQSSFTPNCGALTESISGGVYSSSWSNTGITLSNAAFPLANTYTVEADVTAASGSWPGIYWLKNTTTQGYADLVGSSQFRISKSGAGIADFCQGHNWASSTYSYSSVVGLWSLTWIGTGNIIGSFPTVGTVTSTDTEHPKDADLRLGIGGISSGSGSMEINWIRVRKYAASTPTYSLGTEGSPSIITPGPVVDLGASNAAYCAGSDITLDAGAGYLAYLWSDASTSQTLTVSTPGQYYVDVMNPNGCTSSDTVDVTETPLPVVDFGPDSVACGGTAVTLNAGAGYAAYDWSTSGTGQTESITVDGDYWVQVTDMNGCQGGDTVNVSFGPVVLADFTSSSTDLDASFTNNSSNAVSYSWDFGDGGTSTSQNPTHTYPTSGSYDVCLTVTGSDDCTNTYCETIQINVTGINEIEDAFFTVFPVPASAVLFADMELNGSANYDLTDLSGKTVMHGTLQQGSNKIDISTLNNGVYVLRVQADGMSFSKRVAVQR